MNPASKFAPRAQPLLRDKVKNLVHDEIRLAAEQVFAEQGIQSAKMEDIAARAGVSVGTLYNYFADRSALLEAVMLARRDVFLATLAQTQADTVGRPFRERIEAFLEVLLSHFASQRPFYLLVMQAEQMTIKKTLHAYAPGRSGFMGSLYTEAEELMAQGLSEGALRDDDPVRLANFFVGTARALALSTLLDPDAPDLRSHKDVIVGYFLHGAAK